MKGMFKSGVLGAIVLAFAMAAGSAQAAYRYGGPSSGYYGGTTGYGGVLRCESRNGRTTYCRVDTRAGVRLINQTSQSACIRGRTWGVNRDYVWVSRGCRARFEVGASQYGYGYGSNAYYDDRYGYAGDPYYDNGGAYDSRGYGYYDNRDYDRNTPYYGSARVLRCESHDGRYNFCGALGGVGNVEIRRQLSDSTCRRNQTWGYRSGGVWVDRGCRAEFIIY
jgi:hypothetical protein